MNHEELRNLILDNKTSDVVVIDDLSESLPVDRAAIVSALKAMEREGFGKFVIGRRGGKSRFIFGHKENLNISQKVTVLVAALEKTIIEKLEQNPNDLIVINVKDLANKFLATDVVSAFKILESKNLGMFVIGRRGAQSRFEVGRKRGEIKSKVSGSEYDLVSPEDGPFSKDEENGKVSLYSESPGYYVLIFGEGENQFVMLQSNHNNGYHTVLDSIRACDRLRDVSENDLVDIEKKLIRFGFSKI